MKPLDSRATWLVSRAQLRGHALLQAAFQAAGSRPYHYRILAVLAERGALSQADIGRHTGLDRSDVSVATDTLRTRGLLERDPDPTDRRRHRVTVTEEGRSELHRLDQVLDDVQGQLLAPLLAPERVVLLDLLARLVDPGPPGTLGP